MVFEEAKKAKKAMGLASGLDLLSRGKRGCSFDYFYRATSTDIMSDLSSVRVEFASYSSSRTASNVFVI